VKNRIIYILTTVKSQRPNHQTVNILPYNKNLIRSIKTQQKKCRKIKWEISKMRAAVNLKMIALKIQI